MGSLAGPLGMDPLHWRRNRNRPGILQDTAILDYDSAADWKILPFPCMESHLRTLLSPFTTYAPMMYLLPGIKLISFEVTAQHMNVRIAITGMAKATGMRGSA